MKCIRPTIESLVDMVDTLIQKVDFLLEMVTRLQQTKENVVNKPTTRESVTVCGEDQTRKETRITSESIVPSFSFPEEPEKKVDEESNIGNNYFTVARLSVTSNNVEKGKMSYFVPIPPTRPSREHFPDECLYIPEINDTNTDEICDNFDKGEAMTIDTEYDRGNPKKAKIIQIGWKSINFAKQYYITSVRPIETNSFVFFRLGLSTRSCNKGYELLKNDKVVETTPIELVLEELFSDLLTVTDPTVVSHGIGDF